MHLLETALLMTFATPTAAEFATPTSSAVAEAPPPPPPCRIAVAKDFALSSAKPDLVVALPPPAISWWVSDDQQCAS